MMDFLRMFVLILLFVGMQARAVCSNTNVGQNDSIVVSLLTCSPGEDLYSMFGHSGIRVHNLSTGEDVVFNYGMFNYDADNFIYRFVKGETDYELGAEYANGFFYRYNVKGHGVVEQVLNLTHEQKSQLCMLLYENYRPENRVYRYNFLYDNCTTRARDVIEKSVENCGGEIVYGDDVVTVTFRTILHSFTNPYPWAEFGIDMLLGAEVDKVVSKRERMFIPSLYEADLEVASIFNADGGEKPLLLSTNEVIPNRIDSTNYGLLSSPRCVFWTIFFLCFAISVRDVRRRRIAWVLDMVLMLVQGLAGIVISFLFFFSEHPAVGSNWLVIVFNPLPLLMIYWMISSRRRCQTNWLWRANLAVLLVFVIAIPVIPQSFNPAMIPLVLTLLLRSASGEVVAKMKSRGENNR